MAITPKRQVLGREPRGTMTFTDSQSTQEVRVAYSEKHKRCQSTRRAHILGVLKKARKCRWLGGTVRFKLANLTKTLQVEFMWRETCLQEWPLLAESRI